MFKYSNLRRERIKKSNRLKNVYILGAVSLFNDFSSEMIYPLIPSFVKSVLGLGPAFLGILEGIAESTNSILKLFAGYFSDKIKKRKPFAVGGYAISNLLRPLIGLTRSWGVLLFLRFSDRVGKGIRTSPRDAMIADYSPTDRRGFAFGFQRGMDHTGAVLGSITASLLLYFFTIELKTIFLLSVIPGIIAVLLMIFGVRSIHKKDGILKNRVEVPEKYLTRDKNTIGKKEILKFSDFKKLGKQFSLYLVVLVIFTLGNSTDAFLLLRASEVGFQITVIPLLWAILHISKALFCILGGYISDKIGRKVMILSGWFVYFLTYLGFAYFNKYYLIYLLFIIYGLYFGLTEGVEKALVADIVPKENIGTAFGFYNLSLGIATLPASIIFGFIWKAYSFRAAFLTGALISIVSSLMLLFLKFGKKDSK
ncbi:MAG: MFS transporter [Actinobacteria bacterium]|nr:MFS transporter [Actinomycetota bacterium]MBL7124408.1 MFS transporter [Actinomycetota bacterium]